MRKTVQIFASAILALAFAQAGIAAGVYDGIYQSAVNAKSYATLHQSGNSVIVAVFDIDAVTGAILTNKSGQINGNLDTWELYQGTISGTRANIVGETNFKTCKIGITLDFDAVGNVTSSVTSMVQTAKGAAQGVNCFAGSAIGTVVKFNRAF